MYGDRTESKGKKAAPTPKPTKTKPYSPPYKVGMGDVKTNVDRKRAEDYKSGKTAPSKGNPTYAQSIRAAYAAAPPQQRREQADEATTRSKLKGAKTFNGMDLSMSRENRIVLQEHQRRVRALQMARDYVNPNNDVSADMSVAKTFKKNNPVFDESGRLQTGQTAYGERPKSNADTQLAAAHPGIETGRDRWVADFANKVNENLPLWYRRGEIERAPGDYSKESQYQDPIKDIKPATGAEGGSAEGIIGALDFATNFNNIGSQAGHAAGNFINDALPKLANLPIGNSLPGVSLGFKALAASGDVTGNAAKDVVDMYAQALPSLYALGDATYSAVAHGDTAKLKEQAKGLEAIAKDPIKSLHDHPLLVAMMAKGGLSVVGRTAGAATRTAGRAATAGEDAGAVRRAVANAATAVGGQKLGEFGSTVGREPVYLLGKGTPIARRYSHDVISKHLAQKPFDAFIRRDSGRLSGLSKDAHNKQALTWEKRAIDEHVGGNEATRRLHRQAMNAFLAKTLPGAKNARNLVPFIAERSVRKLDTLKPDLERRLRHLKQQEKKIKASNPDGLYSNRTQQARIGELLADKKLMKGGKQAQQAFDAAREIARRQNSTDEGLTYYGHVNTAQTLKAKAFTYAMEHMDAKHDKEARPTPRKLMKDKLAEAERKAGQKAAAAKGKLDTAERNVRAEQRDHATKETHGRVPGGKERPFVLQALDRQLHEVRTKLRSANRRTEAQAGRAGEASGSARVRSDKYDQQLLNRDGQYRKLRGEFAETSGEKQAAQSNYNNTHGEGISRGAETQYTDARRAEAKQRLDEATAAHDASHARLHAYLDDVDAAAARGTTKVAGGASTTSKAEVHYHTKGRGPVGSLRKAERENGLLKLSRDQRAALYEHERHLERQISKAEREASKLKSSDHERLRGLVEERDRLKGEHEDAVAEHEAVRQGNKAFGKVKKRDQTFIPGLTDKDGIPLSIEDIDRHMKDNGIEGGLEDTAWFSHRPGISQSASGFVDPGRAPYEARYTRSGKSAKQGLYDASIEALASSMTRSQGILDALGARRRFVDTFVKPKTVLEDGTAVWYRNAQDAANAARQYNREHGLINPDNSLKKGALQPYMVSDQRLDAVRRRAQQDKFDPGADEAVTADNQIALRPSLGAEIPKVDPPPGNYGLTTNTAIKRLKEHEASAGSSNAAERVFAEYTQKWRNAVLYGTSAPKWVFGNFAELALRLSVAGAGPRSFVLGMRILAELEKQAGHPQEASFVLTYLTGAGHFSGTMAREINFSRKYHDDLRAAVQAIAEKPGVGTVLGGWKLWKRGIAAMNHHAEYGGAAAAIGKLALKDRESWRHLNNGWKDALRVSDEAVAHVAKGLMGTTEQVRYARHVYSTIGRYTNLSPSARQWVANYTPFGLWFANALKFGLATIPRQHPLFGALLASAYVATEKDRKERGQTLFGSDLPPFLQGTLKFAGYGPDGVSSHNFQRYTPFSAFANPGETAGQNLLPQLSDLSLGLVGRDYTFKQMQLSSGKEPDIGDNAKYAAYVFFEGMIPFLSFTHQALEKKGKPYMDDYIWSLKTKPGTKAKSAGQALEMLAFPGYGYKNDSSTGPKTTGGIPSLPDPGASLPDPDSQLPG